MTALAMFVSTATFANDDTSKKTDFLLIGGGIMSASLGTWLHELQPDWKQVMVEKLDGVALESSNGWNNAGTGHSANMELNYTPERPDGTIDVSKALDINEQFMISRQFWTAQVKRGILHDPHSFINSPGPYTTSAACNSSTSARGREPGPAAAAFLYYPASE